MKHIVKAAEPAKLRDWRLAQKSAPQNLRYGNIPRAEMKTVRESLWREQGGICAYTMWRIGSVAAGHIEHFHPQSLPPYERQIAYENMLYCHPGEGDGRCGFGAHEKADSAECFVSPLDATCELRFRFQSNGNVKAADDGDTVAQRTIEVMSLNHPILLKAREAAIQTLPIFKRRRVTASESRRLAREALQRDGEGLFPQFAVAIHQAYTRHAAKQFAREAALAKKSR